MTSILVIAPQYKYAVDWARELGLDRSEWQYVSDYRQILSVENVQFHIINGSDWTVTTLQVCNQAHSLVLSGRATYYG